MKTTRTQILLFQVSLLIAAKNALLAQTTFVKNFYDKLLSQNPGLTESHFKGVDMEALEKKMASVLEMLPDFLREPQKAILAFEDLGKKHKNIPIKEEEWAAVGGALIETFQTWMGSDFTPEVKEALQVIYGDIVAYMKEGIAEA